MARKEENIPNPTETGLDKKESLVVFLSLAEDDLGKGEEEDEPVRECVMDEGGGELTTGEDG